MLVGQVMKQRRPLCHRAQPLVDAALLMHSRDVAAIPVTDSNHRLVGMLSVDDLVRWEANTSKSRGWVNDLESTVLVAHVMTHEVITLSSDESITQAARVMRYVGRSVRSRCLLPGGRPPVPVNGDSTGGGSRI